MDCRLVITPKLVTKSEMLELVRAWGGHWLEYPTSTPEQEDGHGFIDPIEKDPAKIYIYFTHDLTLDYDPEEIEDIHHLLGTAPMTLISVDIPSDQGSDDLAQDFINDTINHFGGVCDYQSSSTQQQSTLVVWFQ